MSSVFLIRTLRIAVLRLRFSMHLTNFSRDGRRRPGISIRLRGNPPGLIHHSDRGSQYASRDYRQALRTAGITASMSRKGNCYDNAAMESFFATLKTEGLDRCPAESKRHAELTVREYIETFYNPRRMHSSLGYMSPLEYKTQHYRQTSLAA